MSQASSSTHRRVLVVEDDVPSALLTREALALLDCDVTLAGTGEDAVGLVASTHFDLVFMDYHLPRLNGIEATVRIRSTQITRAAPRLPIIGLTASAMPEEREACLRSGMDDVLLKPFLLPDLLKMVDKWCPVVSN